jgi:hypothetical protein
VAGAAEAVGLGVAEVAGSGRDPYDDLLGGGDGRDDVPAGGGAGGVPCDRARAPGGSAAGLGGAVPPGPAGRARAGQVFLSSPGSYPGLPDLSDDKYCPAGR